jgi:hypothetical protein
MSTSLKQKIFNRVSQHLLKQKIAAKSEFGACAYRGEEGLVCAIGCLISDKYYKRSFEGRNAAFAPVAKAVEKSLGVEGQIAKDRDMLSFLVNLQSIHDDEDTEDETTTVLRWGKSLKDIAGKEKLKLPACLKSKSKPKAKKGI